jgi:hypothetical protein
LLRFRFISMAFVALCSGRFWCETGADANSRFGRWAIAVRHYNSIPAGVDGSISVALIANQLLELQGVIAPRRLVHRPDSIGIKDWSCCILRITVTSELRDQYGASWW